MHNFWKQGKHICGRSRLYVSSQRCQSSVDPGAVRSVCPLAKNVRGRCHNQKLSSDQCAPHHFWHQAPPSLGAQRGGLAPSRNRHDQIPEHGDKPRPSWLFTETKMSYQVPPLHGFRLRTVRPSCDCPFINASYTKSSRCPPPSSRLRVFPLGLFLSIGPLFEFLGQCVYRNSLHGWSCSTPRGWRRDTLRRRKKTIAVETSGFILMYSRSL